MRLSSGSGRGRSRGDALALEEGQSLVGCERTESLGPARGPAHFNDVELGPFAQAHRDAELALRQIRAAAAQFPGLDQIATMRRQTGADAVGVAGGPHEPDGDPVVGVALAVAQQAERLPGVKNQEVGIAV